MAIPHRKALDATPQYVAGMRPEEVMNRYGLKEVIKLSSNENALGPPPSALKAAAEVLAGMARYPDPMSFDLRSLISRHDGVAEERILISHGLEEMIPALCRAYINPGDESVQPELTFIKYEIGVRIMDGLCIKVPMRNLEIDLDAMLAAVTDRTRVTWICSPNNPTGTYTPKHELIRFLEALPPTVLAIHDETYREFTEAEDYPWDTVDLLDRFPNLVIMRSFSKAYGLAGFRLGYMLADPAIAADVFKVREIFSVDAVASAAAAAALVDHDYLDQVRAVIGEGRSYLSRQLARLPSDLVRTVESQANFIYLETPFDSRMLFEAMLRKGVIVRPIGNRGLRVTVGLYRENVRFMEVFRDALAEAEHMHHPGVTA